MRENIDNIEHHSSEKSSPPKTFKFFQLFKKLALFLLLLGMIASVVFAWRIFKHAQYEINQNSQALQRLFKQQILEQDHLKNKIAVLELKLSQQAHYFSQENAKLLQQINQSSVNQQSWKITQIFYLVRTAHLALTAQHNVSGALLLLKQAEKQLNLIQVSQETQGTPDIFLANFHRELLKNIALLENIPVLDIDALLTKLSALKDQAPELSILVEPKPNTTILQNTPHEAHKKWWRHAWNNIKASLQQLVIVRHREDKMPALISPEEQLYLQENLQLLLMQAQWALINHEADIYQKTLKQARLWVEKYYVQNAANTQGFLKDLHFLILQPISPVLPDLLASVPQEN